ncbi:energy transducer TonB [Alteromonas oceanisediminis]|uniref:energy transducer TonB n=1 Tax=Alteromonas oceanisediminis TaxID=2836180 RepID=UPI001BD9CB51|nr:energy transducer TonB [Alteromonas oceanisediminis]MBT0587379.1 energy transducer TonB [Alteromonas oceanisediminis]
MKNTLMIKATLAGFFSLLLAPTVLANSDPVILKTAVVQTLLVPENEDSLSWERTFPETLVMSRELERAGIRGCGIFSFNIGKDGQANDIETEASAPSFGLSRLAKDYLREWRWKPKQNGGIEERVLLRLDFCITGETQEEAQQYCQYQATLQCKK